MHTRVQLQLEPLLTGSLIPGPRSIVILSSSASFLAHRAEAAPLTGEKKSIFCFLALSSASSHSLFTAASSNSAPKSAGTHSCSIFPGEAGVPPPGAPWTLPEELFSSGWAGGIVPAGPGAVTFLFLLSAARSFYSHSLLFPDFGFSREGNECSTPRNFSQKWEN